MKVSVAMTSYNGERYIGEQLDSIADQTCLPSEVIVSDDGSSDSTLKIIEKFSLSSPFPVRIHRNKVPLGWADNSLNAAGLCSGDLIAYCDQDDFWLPRKIETARRVFLDAPSVSLFYHSSLLTNDKLEALGGRFPDFRKTDRKRRLTNPLKGHSYGFSMVFSSRLKEYLPYKRLYDQSLTFEELKTRKLQHDYWTYFLCDVLGDIIYWHEPLALYRQHDKSVLGAPTRKNPINFFTAPSTVRNKAALLDSEQTVDSLQKLARIFEGIADEVARPLSDRKKFHEAAIEFRRRCTPYISRGELYRAINAPKGIYTLAKMLVQLQYRPRSRNGLGFKNLVRDMIQLASRRQG